MHDTYYLDTNFIISYVYRRSKKQYNFAKNYFEKAKNQEIKLILLPEIIIETEYILRKYYQLNRQETIEIISSLAQWPYVELDQRKAILDAFKNYSQKNID
ncbi:MAG: PIN domain-containing protein, partial [bacterium]|nr:PIN domain-containing protein [bacterium]